MAGNPHDATVPRVFKLLVLMAWIGVFWGLMTSVSGAPPISRFLSPDYWWLIKLGTAILIIYCLATYYIIPPHMGMGAFAGLIQVGLLMLPIIYLPTAVSSQLSPVAFEKRSVDKIYGGNTAGRESDSQASVAGGEGGRVSLSNLTRKPSAFEGRKVITEGMVYRDEKLGENRFICFRLLIWCCAADARPVGILVQVKNSIDVPAGQWVRVEGVVEKSVIGGRKVIQIDNAEVKTIEPPGIPYLFD